MHHVRTQAPYGLFVGCNSIIFGDLLSGYVWPEWVGLLVTILMTLLGAFVISAPVESSRVDLFGKVFSCFGKNKHTSESGTSDEIEKGKEDGTAKPGA